MPTLTSIHESPRVARTTNVTGTAARVVVVVVVGAIVVVGGAAGAVVSGAVVSGVVATGIECDVTGGEAALWSNAPMRSAMPTPIRASAASSTTQATARTTWRRPPARFRPARTRALWARSASSGSSG